MSPAMHFSDRMSESDALIWNIETDPQLRSTITGVWLFDGTPDWGRFRRKVERCALEIPRLRQRVVSDPLGLAPPRWELDPHFDLDFHVRRVHVPGEGSLRDLLDLAEPIGMQAFDRDRPLWELTAVDGLQGGRAGLVMKLHHAVSDGMGLVRMTAGMIERSPEPDESESEALPEAPEIREVSDLERTWDAAAFRARRRLDAGRAVVSALGRGLGEFVRAPVSTLGALAGGAASVGRMVRPVSERMSPLLRGHSLSVHFDTLVVPLDVLKRAARTVDGTLNDAFVGAVTGGWRRYHEALGMPVDELRMNMPINTRSGDRAREAGNQFAPVRFEVPVGIADPGRRMRRIHQLVAEQRAEPALPLLDPISAGLGSLPGDGASRLLGSMMKAVDFTTSNVPGPRYPVYVSGARIEHMFGFGPLAGAAANITCFSYDGDIAIAINSDPAAVAQPALLAECMRKGLEEVCATA